MTSICVLRIALAAGFCFGLPAAVKAQTVINSVPYVITVSGKYVLGGNLNPSTASPTAITIKAPNVVLDLNQVYVSGPGATPLRAPL